MKDIFDKWKKKHIKLCNPNISAPTSLFAIRVGPWWVVFDKNKEKTMAFPMIRESGKSSRVNIPFRFMRLGANGAWTRWATGEVSIATTPPKSVVSVIPCKNGATSLIM